MPNKESVNGMPRMATYDGPTHSRLKFLRSLPKQFFVCRFSLLLRNLKSVNKKKSTHHFTHKLGNKTKTKTSSSTKKTEHVHLKTRLDISNLYRLSK